jgi:mono/diheme cytochrome c family protein
MVRVALLVLTVVLVGTLWPERSSSQNSAVERGKYLVGVLGCNDCHTPKVMGPDGPEVDAARLLSGQPASQKLPPPPKLPRGPWIAVTSANLSAWSGPWGISYAANLTPDKETGLGNWSLQTFVRTMRTGRVGGVGRPILPPMPWQDYATLTDGDLAAVFAYLRSIPPIHNRVPPPVIAPPPGHGE